MWLWRLTSPTAGYMQAGDPGEPVVLFNPSLNPWEQAADGQVPVLRTEDQLCPSLAVRVHSPSLSLSLSLLSQSAD